jgi:hypothetical protein
MMVGINGPSLSKWNAQKMLQVGYNSVNMGPRTKELVLPEKWWMRRKKEHYDVC